MINIPTGGGWLSAATDAIEATVACVRLKTTFAQDQNRHVPMVVASPPWSDHRKAYSLP